MPLIKSAYKPITYPGSGHIQTILPALFRSLPAIPFKRERIATPDNDFLDLDWLSNKSEQLVIISHGLEGSTSAPYLRGMASFFFKQGFDLLAWNYRGCSGEINKQLRFYHSGETSDLDFVVNHALNKKEYKSAALIGISIGGNITLKYLGEKSNTINPKIKTAVCFSVPCDLKSGAMHLAKPGNFIYMKRFIKSLRQKIKLKAISYPDQIDTSKLDTIKNFLSFDQTYTAPLHGFLDAYDYWQKCSSLFYLNNITIPTLMVNALNDPFLTKECYPFDIAKKHSCLYLETPSGGGHCGFYQNNSDQSYWSENRALEFIKNYIYF